jgi:hypothetical protein
LPAIGKKKPDDSGPSLGEVIAGSLPTCTACGGTGLNSKGCKCWPCERREMVEWLKKPTVVKEVDLFGDS